MMRKILIYLIGLLFISGAVVAIVIAAKSSKDHNDKNAANTSAVTPKKSAAVSKKACDIFTLADAKQLLGGNVKGGENTVPAASPDLTVSSCSYTQDTGNSQPVNSAASAALLMRHPTTSSGISSNQNEFGNLRPAGVQDVPGYGDAAYWDGEHGQLNILKNNDWYILSYGTTTPADRTLDQATQLAAILIGKM
jgi:hypothetical protein